jgi:hypothetical protein
MQLSRRFVRLVKPLLRIYKLALDDVLVWRLN